MHDARHSLINHPVGRGFCITLDSDNKSLATVALPLQDGVTALYLASANGNVRMVQMLLQYGAIVNVQRNVSYGSA